MIDVSNSYIEDKVWSPVWDMKKMKFIPVEFEIIEIIIHSKKENNLIVVEEKYRIYSKEYNITTWRKNNALFDSKERCEIESEIKTNNIVL